MAGAAILGEVSENFPNDTAKFEAMARKTTGDEDIGAIRVGVNDKMGIRGVGKEARVHGQRRPIPVGEIAAYKGPQDRLIFRMAVTIHSRWIIDRLLQMMPARHLKPGIL